jgi:hypothetical protein
VLTQNLREKIDKKSKMAAEFKKINFNRHLEFFENIFSTILRLTLNKCKKIIEKY